MAARLLSRSAPSTKPKDDGGTSGVMFGDVTPCRVACASMSRPLRPGQECEVRRLWVLLIHTALQQRREQTKCKPKQQTLAAWARGTRPLL